MKEERKGFAEETRHPAAVYALTLAAVFAAWIVRWLLDPLLLDYLPFVTFFAAVAAAAWLGGFRTALLATTLGLLLAWYFFVPPRHGFALDTVQHSVGLALYLVVSLSLAAFGEAIHRGRRRAEGQRQLLRTTLSSIGDAVISTDDQGRVVNMNPVAESLLGWTQEEAVGRPLQSIFRIVNEKTRLPADDPVRKVLAEGVVAGLANHTILIAKDGTEHPIDDSAAPIRDDEGRLLGVVLIFRDISERRRTERVAAEARTFAENVVDAVREPLLVLDRDLRVRSASRAYFDTFRVAPEDTVGRPIDRLGTGQWDHPELRKLLEEVLARDTQFGDFEVESDFTGLGYRTMSLSARRIYREGGHSELILLAIEDITQRKDVQVMERRLASIVETSDDAIVSKSLQGIIKSWNAGAERLFGYTAEEAVGRHISFLIPEERQDEEERILERLRKGERVDHFDTVRMRKDGRPVQVSLTISPLKDDKGRVVGASKIARDITEQKRLENALRKYAADLSESDRRKNEFLAMLAHELRNPLAPIRNSLHIMRLTGGDGKSVTVASNMMERQVGQMVRLIDDLLDASRISRGKMELRTERVELGSVVRDAVEAARPPCENRDQAISVTLPPEPIYVEGDPARLTQILGNLLNNACKFTPPGGHVQLHAEVEGETVVLRVEDNGIGIAEDQISLIFEMFSQVDTSLERTQGGLGIGLTLAKKLVEMHNGTINVHSKGPGQGSTFTVRLSISRDTAEPAPPETSVEKPRMTSHRILVVDDNRDSATSLAMLLRITGNETHTAFDGLEAVEAVEIFNPDVVLLDIGLPKLNGYEACRRLRDKPGSDQLVIIALTGWGQEEDREKSRLAGFNGHLVKPVDLVALTKMLAEVKSSPA